MPRNETPHFIGYTRCADGICGELSIWWDTEHKEYAVDLAVYRYSHITDSVISPRLTEMPAYRMDTVPRSQWRHDSHRTLATKWLTRWEGGEFDDALSELAENLTSLAG